jgi:hypothetical protein
LFDIFSIFSLLDHNYMLGAKKLALVMYRLLYN